MEEDNVKIKKIITTIDDGKSYSIDVDETTTFHEFKKILVGAAHLLKNCFRIYHGNTDKEYTNDYDDMTIKEIFSDLDPVPLRIISFQDLDELEKELISVSFNINVPCKAHIGKYKMLYCFTCSESICTDCLQKDHKGHRIQEKADYLAPAQLIMNTIFSDSSLYKADSRLSKYFDCTTFRSNLKINIFDNLRKLINDLELKFSSCLEFFSISEDETERNTNENLELLKKYCVEYFIKLKNDINTKGIIIDDQIFLSLYYKLKEIEKFKKEYFEENKQKYEKLNTLLAPFIKQVEKISEEIKIVFDTYLNKDLYETFKNSIQENIVEQIQKDQVNDLMFRNLGVPRKSLNRMSLGNVTSYKKTGRNSFLSPNKVLSNQKPEKNPFPRAVYSEQRQGQVSQNLLGFNSLSSQKGEMQNNYTTLTWDKQDKQNIKIGLPTITEKNDTNTSIAVTNVNNMGGNLGVVNRKEVIEETVKTNINSLGGNMRKSTGGVSNMKSILNNNINLNTQGNLTISGTNKKFDNVNNLNDIQKETTIYKTTETIHPEQITKFSTQQEYNIHGMDVNTIGNISELQGQKNITKTETTKTVTTTTTSNNVQGQIAIAATNNNANINTSNYSKGYEMTQYTTTANQHSGTQQVSSSSNIFGGNLIQVLNKEISKNEQEFNAKNQNQNQNIINETHTEHIIGENGEIIKKVTKTQTVEYNSPLGNMDNYIFMFMCPLFNSNQIVGAFESENTGKIEVDFSQAFSNTDIHLNEFPLGGAYCNYNKILYFTGGQEKQNGLGKIFLRISVQLSDYRVNLTKMPNMLYSHWNHSMIANDNYVFVVGGYNSNKCEYFNFKTLKWGSMPNLNSEERQRAMLVIYKDYLYAFMGYTQFGILDSVERINIAKLGTSQWEKVSISNPERINLKLYGSGIYNNNGILYFIGGKVGFGNDENNYTNEIFKFNFDKMQFSPTNVSFPGELNFIENQFHHCNGENIGNFVESNGGCLASVPLLSVIQ